MRILVVMSLFLSVHAGAQNLIGDRCRTLLLSDTAYATEESYRVTDDIRYYTDARGYFEGLARDGHWPDIDYHSDLRSSWIPSWHLYRVMLLCRAYYKNHDPAYLDAAHRALQFWIGNDFKCSNWWQNQINTPFTFSSILLMLGNDATSTERAYLDNVLAARIPVYKPTGQNLIWQLDNQARVALLHKDYRQLAGILKDMQQVVTVTTMEGIQPDYSFQQHGPMLQFGNYGLHFVNSLLFWMTVTAGTPLAFPPDKQKILFDYCSEGLNWTLYRGRMDLTAIGRQLRADCGQKRGDDLRDVFRLLKSFVPDDFEPLDGNKSFWRSDYMIQRSGERYMMSVKMHGSFVHRIESINGENERGAFLNDGVTLFQRTGKEYKNIGAMWNWAMLPGVTSDTSIDPGSREAVSSANHSDFVGQVSDTVEGISAMHYNRLGIQAYKSYFMMDGLMVALGAGITSAHRERLVTTVNQRYYHGGALSAGEGNAWLWQDSTAYIFLTPHTAVHVDTDFRGGNWSVVDKASPDKLVADSVLTIYLPQAGADTYAYLVRPGVGLEETKDLFNNHPLKVLMNTAGVQAVETGGTIMAVFYAPGTFRSDGISVSADKPCALIWKNKYFWLSDPTRTQHTIHLKVNDAHDLSISLPAGDAAGSTTRVAYPY